MSKQTKVIGPKTSVFPRAPRLPKVPRVPIFSAPPPELRSAVDEGSTQYVSELPPNPPAELAAMRITKPEWAVYWALERLGKKPDIDFRYRGTYEFAAASGRTQLDFVMIDGSGIAIEVQGTYWHYQQGADKIAMDQFRRVTLMGQGYRVVFVDENDVLRAPIYYTQEALLGHEHAYNTRGYFVQDNRSSMATN